eukprot:TRINITY_DN4555_c0_g1_i1.p1 TRINITY_DN4555_c0_g1~~TRINITY_DN4555_c0_g1_i1.p1  ORF type:complete len:526 (+),score=93.63 TRINITY_DN4555_c0_g1_i1:59-1579(+)
MAGGYYHDADGGEKLKADPHFTGVVGSEDRKCRDLGCALFLVACLIGMGIVTIVAGKEADLDLLNSDARSDVTKEFHHIEDNKYVIMVGCFATMVLATIWLELVRLFTKPVVYFSIAVGIAAVIGTGAFVLSQGGTYATFVAICIFVIAGILVLITIYLRKKINFSCAVISAGAKGLSANRSIYTLVIPTILVMTLLYLLWWFVTMIYLYAVKGDKIDCSSYNKESTCKSYGCSWDAATNCTGQGYDVQEASRYAMIYLVFMLFWGMMFLQGLARTTISGAIAEWYFTRDKKSIPCGNSFKYLGWCLTYHLGSIALGSLLIAIFKFVNWVLAKAQKEADNCVVKIIVGCVQCICGCIERIIAFVTKFAYVYIAMHGGSFTKAAKDVKNLFSRSRFGSIFMSDLIASFIVHTGMLMAVGIVAIATLKYMDSTSATIVLIVFCYIVFWVVGVSIEVAADSVVVCYMEDAERNSASRDYIGDQVYFSIDESINSHSKGVKGHVETYGTS